MVSSPPPQRRPPRRSLAVPLVALVAIAAVLGGLGLWVLTSSGAKSAHPPITQPPRPTVLPPSTTRGSAPSGPTTTVLTAPNTPGGQAAGVFLAGDIGKALPSDLVGDPAITGSLIRVGWNQLELGDDRFDWTLLDSQVRASLAAHKPYMLAVLAGGYVPDWVYGTGVQKLAFTVVPQKGNVANCRDIAMPPPWDKGYLALVDRLAHRLHDHLAGVGPIDQLVQVKIEGINTITEELRLPADNGTTVAQSGCPASNDLVTWQNAGYTPDLVLKAFQAITTSWATAFPATPMAVPVIPGSSFPDLGPTGPQKKAGTALLDAIVKWGVTTYGHRFGVQFNALRQNAGTPLDGYREGGALVGYQIANNLYGNPSCPGIVPSPGHQVGACDPAGYEAAIANGVAHGMRWLEVFPNTVRAFPEQTTAAARQLLPT